MLYLPGLQPSSLSCTWAGMRMVSASQVGWEKQLGIRSSVMYPNLSFLFLSCSCTGRGSQKWCLREGVFPQNPSQPHSTWPNSQHPFLWDCDWSPWDTQGLGALPLHLGKGPTQNLVLYENFSPFTSLLGISIELSALVHIGSPWVWRRRAAASSQTVGRALKCLCQGSQASSHDRRCRRCPPAKLRAAWGIFFKQPSSVFVLVSITPPSRSISLSRGEPAPGNFLLTSSGHYSKKKPSHLENIQECRVFLKTN